eukprot:10794-Pelagococcus_subviridis.AAC.1
MRYRAVARALYTIESSKKNASRRCVARRPSRLVSSSLGIELADLLHHLLQLRLRELLQTLRHHRVLVVLQLLHVRHVLVHDSPDVGPDPGHRQPADERELNDVPRPDRGHALRLEAVVEREPEGGDADAD